MTSVHINIVNPDVIYNNLNVNHEHRVSDNDFISALRAELISALGAHGVKNVTVNIHKTIDVYTISLNNVKNDWQEEKIREECDITCISFMKKENLLKLKWG